VPSLRRAALLQPRSPVPRHPRRQHGHLEAKRLARGDARSDGSATIRIIYRGVELVGEVRVLAVDPRVKPPPRLC
jgi:hypothetical protein